MIKIIGYSSDEEGFILLPRKPQRLFPSSKILSKREIVFMRDGYRCLKCGSEEYLTIDHIKPVSKGGKNRTSNMQTLCYKCNQEKGVDIVNYLERIENPEIHTNG